ncbi:LamG domain-containing protein [Flavobacterium oreochromis]|uniref:LamG domain-containing protein n=1 Tax=Flavobacterium oreochromis TaxID=2906078 RepID=A0ABW8P5Y9_9FLAO|nr:LamG domain-containing protein [Flavobacterium oreochromis]OWP74102.1 hypothetical protein BWG23_14985 [Flavobacterium oreochromis]
MIKKYVLLLIGFLLFNNKSNSQVVGTPYIVPNIVANKIGLDFDGINDAVSLGNITALNNISQYTIEYWGRFANFVQWTTMISKRITDTERVAHIQFGSTAGEVYAFIGSNYIITTSTMPVNTWTHIAVVFDGTQAITTERLKIYFNGVRQSVTNVGTIPTITTTSNAIFSIGSEYNSTTAMTSGSTGIGLCDMTMTELRIWNVARTAVEILTNKDNFNIPLATSGLLYYYKMNQGIANGNNTGIANLTDSKSGINGSLFNFSLTGNTSNFIALPF